MLQSSVSVPASERSEPGNCAILLINLDRSPERLAFQRAQLGRLGLDFTRIAAVDGSSLSEETYRRHAYRWQRALTRNEVACLLSHAKCWEYAVGHDCNALVLEDDAVLAGEVPSLLARAAGLGGCLVVNLETRGREAYLGRESSCLGSGFYRLVTAVAGSAGYLITPEAARVLLDGLQDRAGLADNYIWSQLTVERLQADPAFCMGLDVMQSYFGLESTAAAGSSIVYRNLSRAEKLRSYVGHPLTAWRRIRSQVSLGVARVILPLVADRRVVAPYPSILANYQALRGVYNG